MKRRTPTAVSRLDAVLDRLHGVVDRPWTFLLLFAAGMVAFWWLRVPQVPGFVAVNSASPAQWVHLILSPDLHDVGGDAGVRNFGKSLFMHVYRLAWNAFEIDPVDLIPGMIVAEMLILVLGLVLLVRQVRPEARTPEVVFTVLIIGWSTALFANLARYYHPFFWGLYYNFTDGFRYAALAAILARRWLPAAVAMAVTAMSHPIGGLFGLAAGGVIWLVDRPRASWRALVGPAAVFAVLAGGWTWLGMRGVEAGGGGIPADLWTAFSRMENRHFHPLANGELLVRTERSLMPLLGMLLLFVDAVRRRPGPADRRLGAAIGLLAAMTVVGVGFSETSVPILIKLQFHRASELMLGLALVVVGPALVDDLTGASRLRRLAAGVLLTAPFMSTWHPGFPSLIVLATTAGVWRADPAPVRRLAGRLLWVALAAVAVGVMLRQAAVPFDHRALTNIDGWQAIAARVGWWLPLALALVVVGARRRAWPALAVLAAALGLLMQVEQHRGRPHVSADAKAMIEAQMWARENTPGDALFMVDPSAPKGWQDLSRRLSFGTARDWDHNAWLYDSDKRIFDEGMRRLARLGVDPTPYLAMPTAGWAGATAFRTAVQRAWDAKTTPWFAEMARDYGIDYFVFDARRVDPAHVAGMAEVYRSDRYLILAAPSP